MSVIWQSKAFWTAVLDMFAGILTLVVGAFWPEQAELVANIWKVLQPVFLVLIAALCTEEIFVPALRQALMK